MQLKQTKKWVLTAFIVFILIEVTARLYYFGLDGLSYSKVNSLHELGQSGLIKLSSEREMWYEFKPNLHTYFKLKRFDTNSHGFRDKEYSLKKPVDTIRVAVCGSSYPAGAGVDIEEAFHTVLEDRLNGESGKIRYEFINMAIGGHTPWQTLEVVKKRALSFEPDLILFCTTPYMYRYKKEPPINKIKPVTYPFFKLYSYTLAVMTKRQIFSKDTMVHRERGSYDPEEIRSIIRGVMSEIQGIRESSGVPIVLVMLENKDNSMEIVKDIENISSEYSVPAINTIGEIFRHHPLTDFCFNRLDCHPNPKAHRLFAEVIYSALEQNSFYMRKS